MSRKGDIKRQKIDWWLLWADEERNREVIAKEYRIPF